MNILLIGATGPTGQEVLNGLLNRDYNITVMARRPDAISEEQRSNVKLLKGDATNKENLRRALKNQDAVIYTIGTGNQLKSGQLFSNIL